MLLTITQNLDTIPHLTGRVNVLQLAQVEAEHMPAHAVRFAPETELVRVAQEVAQAQPELADEAQFVVKKELHRRAVKMTINA